MPPFVSALKFSSTLGELVPSSGKKVLFPAWFLPLRRNSSSRTWRSAIDKFLKLSAHFFISDWSFLSGYEILCVEELVGRFGFLGFQ